MIEYTMYFELGGDINGGEKNTHYRAERFFMLSGCVSAYKQVLDIY